MIRPANAKTSATPIREAEKPRSREFKKQDTERMPPLMSRLGPFKTYPPRRNSSHCLNQYLWRPAWSSAMRSPEK